jgi:hypothetical protein
LPGRRRQVQVERTSVEHRERVLGVVGGQVGVAHACRRRVRLASAGQVSSWNTVSRNPPSLGSSVSAQQSRLVGAVLAEPHDEWAESRCYLGFDVLGKSRNAQRPPSGQEAHPAALTRLNHPHQRITRQRRTPRPWT